MILEIQQENGEALPIPAVDHRGLAGKRRKKTEVKMKHVDEKHSLDLQVWEDKKMDERRGVKHRVSHGEGEQIGGEGLEEGRRRAWSV